MKTFLSDMLCRLGRAETGISIRHFDLQEAEAKVKLVTRNTMLHHQSKLKTPSQEAK